MAFTPRGRIEPKKLARWKATQADLASRSIEAPLARLPRFVAGVDCAFGGERDWVYSVAVVWDREAQRLVDAAGVRMAVTEPYIPGYLSFREGPAVNAALDALTHEFGAILFDGQGRAHPRRCGLATFVGVSRDVPSVGCAKSRLVGEHMEPGPSTGDAAELVHHDEAIGVVLRTRPKTRPLYVSIGHRVDLASAAALVLACRTLYRLPEPTRLADIGVARLKRGERVDVSAFPAPRPAR